MTKRASSLILRLSEKWCLKHNFPDMTKRASSLILRLSEKWCLKHNFADSGQSSCKAFSRAS
jgi:hypothetical protein